MPLVRDSDVLEVIGQKGKTCCGAEGFERLLFVHCYASRFLGCCRALASVRYSRSHRISGRSLGKDGTFIVWWSFLISHVE